MELKHNKQQNNDKNISFLIGFFVLIFFNLTFIHYVWVYVTYELHRLYIFCLYWERTFMQKRH